DRVVRSDHRGVRFEEQQRLLGDLVAEFSGVGGVVAADTDDLRAGDDGREQARLVQWHPLARGLKRRVQGIPGEHYEIVGVVLEDGVAGVGTGGESGYAHSPTVPNITSRPSPRVRAIPRRP